MTFKKWFLLAGIIAVVVAFLILTANFQQVTGAFLEGRDSITIGAIFSITGVAADWGDNSLNGATLAIDEINSGGGINGKKVNFVVENGPANDPLTALNAYQKLIGEGHKILLGTTWSPEGLAIAPNACKDGTVMISPTLGVKEFNETCDYLFNLWPHDEELSRELGKRLFEKGYTKIAILGSLQVWESMQAEVIKKSFEEVGGKVVSYQLVSVDEQDFKAEILKIRESEAQAVVFTNQGTEHISAKRLRETGYDNPFYLVLIDQDKINAAQGAFEGAEVITSFTPTKEFSQKYESKYGKAPDIGSDTSYDAVYLIKKAMEETNSQGPTKIKDYLNSLKSYDGAAGSFVFDGKGGVTKKPKFVIVKNNKMVDEL